MNRRKIKNSEFRNIVSRKALSLIVVACFLASALYAVPQTQPAPTTAKPPAAKKPKAPAKPAVALQKTFDTPEQAADAAIKAAESGDQKALLDIFGPDAADLISSGDAVEDKEARERFLRLAHEKKVVAIDPFDVHQANLTIGNEDWPFPIPIIHRKGRWLFDTKEGRIEVLARRVGENELDAIAVCNGYVDAQIEYASEDRDGNGVKEYAQRIISTPGRHDGLAWQNADGTWGGPVGEGVARAIAEGYKVRTEPFHGYHFRILTSQGPDAPLGNLNYVVKGMMIGGFALIAWPDNYWVTGVKTFIVSNDGVVYQNDLGPNTEKLAAAIQAFNPGPGWEPVDED